MSKYNYPYKPEPDKKEKDYSWLWIVGIILGLIFIPKVCNLNQSGGASGPNYPFDSSYEEGYELEAEINEGRLQEAEIIQTVGKECYEDTLYGLPDEYSRCGKTDLSTSNSDYESSDYGNLENQTTSSCPLGCTVHKSGCNIKGNISQSSGEKIYHVPGQEFYSSTNIHPDFGERWFCTETEAEANGWRKAYN